MGARAQPLAHGDPQGIHAVHDLDAVVVEAADIEVCPPRIAVAACLAQRRAREVVVGGREEALLDGNWLAATEAYKAGMDSGELIPVDDSDLARLRKSSLEFIFQRMHSGTVKEDVASLARNITQIFPLSMEGRTLAPVLGVLRRSAGLCPRCEKPYRGVANACHDCLRGTPEAYQIAWDDQPL